MFGNYTFFRYRVGAKFRNEILINKNRNISFGENSEIYSNKLIQYAGRPFMNEQATNKLIGDMLDSATPFLVARLGATELLNMRTFNYKNESFNHKLERIKQLSQWSGFFPEDVNYGLKFTEMMNDALGKVDVLAVWYQPFEDYYIKKYTSNEMKCTYLKSIEPWKCKSFHWSSRLGGKKVLVIHPFTETIKEQYKRREKIFSDTSILPEFELLTLKSVQTIAGEKDVRFVTWFDALDYMFESALEFDFDVAILGCGAYGFPLAARLKKAGKQAIHLGGATQLMFGIKGKRWDEKSEYAYVREMYNENWVYPSVADKPMKASSVEGGCYW